MIDRLLSVLQQTGLLLDDQDIADWSEAQSLLDDEDIADALWLASKFGSFDKQDETGEIDATDTASPSGTTPPIEVIDDNTAVGVSPPVVSAYMPPATQPGTSSVETPEQGLPIQVQAAPAFSNPRDVGRSLRPLMRKVPSLTRSELDELATVNRIAEQDIWVPILKSSAERWFDLELVIEASRFSFIWQDTLDEFQALLEYQGAFRNVRTWYIEGVDTGQPKLLSSKHRYKDSEQDVPLRSYKELVDASGRRLVLYISDCRSQIWRQGKIHDWLDFWGQRGPTAIVQLLPERLWNQSELDVGFAVQASSFIPGTPNPKLQVRELTVPVEIASADALTMPIVTLTAGALRQWALVVAAAGRQRVPARLFDLSWVKHPERDRSRAIIRPKSAKERVELFMATASPIAQQLACMMAAVPVELSVVHLIQEELLEEVQPVHIAEVYSSGLLEEIRSEQSKPNSSARYDFAEGVRGGLNEITPLDETLGVLEALSQRIARTLGFEIKSFTALLSPKSDWSTEEKNAILPFAQIATEVLHRLGGDYAELAQLVEQDAKGYSDWIQPVEPDRTFPDLEVLEFTTAQLVEPAAIPQFPPLQTQEVEVVTIVFEAEPEGLQQFEFDVATIERRTNAQLSGFLQNIRNLFSGAEQRSEWVIRKQRRQAYQWVEPLGDRLQQRAQAIQQGVERLSNNPHPAMATQLEMVAIPAGTFLMGSPEDEIDRTSSESPQHEVSVPTFFMGKYPITQAQWRFVAELPQVNRGLNPDPSRFKEDKRPVEQVSWYEAMEFCDRLSIYTGREYRLPTEAEWEYACRAGTTTPFHFGETITTDLANYAGTSTYNGGPKGEYRKETTPVDHFGIANAFGLCDMHGNVWEWCLDHWHQNYEGLPIDGSAWLSENEDAKRVVRGGSWYSDPRLCRSAYRYDPSPDNRGYFIGFRVVCVAPRTL